MWSSRLVLHQRYSSTRTQSTSQTSIDHIDKKREGQRVPSLSSHNLRQVHFKAQRLTSLCPIEENNNYGICIIKICALKRPDGMHFKSGLKFEKISDHEYQEWETHN